MHEFANTHRKILSAHSLETHTRTHKLTPVSEGTDSWECHACTLDRRSNKGEDTARANTLISCGMLCINTRLPSKQSILNMLVKGKRLVTGMGGGTEAASCSSISWQDTQLCIKVMYVCVQCIKWRHFPTQGLSAHSSPAVDVQPHLPSPLNIFPKSHSSFLCLTFSNSVFVATYCANSYVSPFFFPSCVSVFTQTYFSLKFFSCFIPPSLFSPCADPVQMASRCCCNSFAFTYISSTNTAKKTLEEMLTTYRMARSGWLKIVFCDILLGLTWNDLCREHSKVAKVKFSKSKPFPYSTSSCNKTRLIYQILLASITNIVHCSRPDKHTLKLMLLICLFSADEDL